MKSAIALLWRGSAARAAVAAARADLASMPLPEAVARRTASPPSPRRRMLSLRAFLRAVAATLEREGETHPCLVRAVALLGEARACGFAPRLSVGVRRGASGALESHAWLVLDGAPFLESHETPERYESITVLPP